MYLVEKVGLGNISAKIVADSIANGKRITTYELEYPRFIHAELMTHRVFSRNASSSRAIPVNKILASIRKTIAKPVHWGKNQSGMQAHKELDSEIGNTIWNEACESACNYAEKLNEAGYHKQIVNRLTEPFAFIKVVVTSTEWSNWFKLRFHKDAQPEIKELANIMLQANNESLPLTLNKSEWHLPYVSKVEWFSVLSNYDLCKISSARCARVSYLNHDKSNPNIDEDFELFDMLATRPYIDKRGNEFLEDDPVHLSPTEHQAMPIFQEDDCSWNYGITHKDRNGNFWSGNFQGWIQNRQLIQSD